MIRKSREKSLRSKSRVKSASQGNHNYQQFAFSLAFGFMIHLNGASAMIQTRKGRRKR